MGIIAGTGHRPDKLGGYSERIHKILIDLAEAALEDYKPEMVISGMALGWDQALAQASINLGIPFTAAIPFQGHPLKWPEESQKRYSKILDKAENIVILSTSYNPGVMQKRNVWMVDQLSSDDMLLALWDGSDGGTRNCIKYAEKKDINIVNLWPIFLELT